jgi:hypothetical protein
MTARPNRAQREKLFKLCHPAGWVKKKLIIESFQKTYYRMPFETNDNLKVFLGGTGCVA